MIATRYQELFKPISIGAMHLRNRIVMAPLHTKFADESGGVTDKLIQYHVERAKGGVGLIIIENTCVDWELGRAAGNPVTIHDDLFRAGLSDLVEAVHRHGARIIPELHHAGRQNLRSNIVGNKQPVAPSEVRSTVGGDEPRAMTEKDIERTIQQFVDGARRAKECGFDGVELHGAHGYLLTQFLSPHTNQRTDKWGGRLENRARFALEIVRRIRALLGPEFPILYRISAEERIPGGLQLDEAIAFVRMLEDAGVDAIDVSAGIYESMPWIFTMQGTPPASLVPLAASIKRAVSIPVIAVSSLGWDPGLANSVLENGDADLISIARTLLADPHWPNKVLKGKEGEIRHCIRCNECVGFLFRGWRVHCVINPETGFEYQRPLHPTAHPKRIVVVGAGLAGLEYAVTASRRGHKVTLLERSKRIGGQLNEARAPSYKREELSRLLNYYDAMLKKWGVDVRLGIDGTIDNISDYAPELVVLATGSKPTKSSIPGSELALLAADVLAGDAEVPGQHVCVVGGNIVGIDVAMYLSERGKAVTIVQLEGDIAAEANPVLQWQLKDLLTDRGIKILSNYEVLEISDQKVIASSNGERVDINCDSTVISPCYESRDVSALEQALIAQGVAVQKVSKPGLIYHAVHGGYWAAVEI